jgi:hypothetical protein
MEWFDNHVLVMEKRDIKKLKITIIFYDFSWAVLRRQYIIVERNGQIWTL